MLPWGFGVVRTGRTRNADDVDVRVRHSIKNLLAMLFLAGLFVAFPWWLYTTEVNRRETFFAFTEVRCVGPTCGA